MSFEFGSWSLVTSLIDGVYVDVVGRSGESTRLVTLPDALSVDDSSLGLRGIPLQGVTLNPSEPFGMMVEIIS